MSKMLKIFNFEGWCKISVFFWMIFVFDCDCVCLVYLLISIYYGFCLLRNVCVCYGKEIDKSVLYFGLRRDEVIFLWIVDVGFFIEGVLFVDIGGNEVDIIFLEL